MTFRVGDRVRLKEAYLKDGNKPLSGTVTRVTGFDSLTIGHVIEIGAKKCLLAGYYELEEPAK